MLDVKKTILADGIPFLYAAAQVMVDGRRYYVVSSENPGGKALLIDAETEECFLVAGWSRRRDDLYPGAWRKRYAFYRGILSRL